MEKLIVGKNDGIAETVLGEGYISIYDYLCSLEQQLEQQLETIYEYIANQHDIEYNQGELRDELISTFWDDGLIREIEHYVGLDKFEHLTNVYLSDYDLKLECL